MSPIPYFEVAAVTISILALVVSIWMARSAKKEANAAANQYDLAVEQHRQALFSTVIVYPLQYRYNPKNRQLDLGVTNAGQVPVTNIRVDILHTDSSTPICSWTAPILFEKRTETVPIGDRLYKFLGEVGTIKYSPTGHSVETDKPVVFFVESAWIPSVVNAPTMDSLRRKLVLRLESGTNIGGAPVFDVLFGGENESET